LNKYKVCVYAICKNEEKFVDAWVDSMSEADLIVVTDTGSTDKTVEKLRKKGVIVYSEEIKPWRFDVARNISLVHVPEDVDICVCTDLDELFQKGWRKLLEDKWSPEVTMANYMYNWSHKADGTPDVQINYFKVHSRFDYKWQYPIHECLKYIGKGPEKKVFVEGMILDHYPDPAKSRGSYLGLLDLAVKESPEDDRMMYYLGREYMYKGMWEKCIETLKKHLSLKNAVWREERCASMRWIARSFHELKNPSESLCWYYRAIAECPYMREPYIECAQKAYLWHEWHIVYFMVEQALKITQKSMTYTNMGYCWNHTPYDLGAISCYHLGLLEKSREYAKQALSLDPKNERLRNNLKIIEEKLEKVGC
jgi:glycosyltransferase involved in cell wall biosynthesis